jgi:hypothetical protein
MSSAEPDETLAVLRLPSLTEIGSPKHRDLAFFSPLNIDKRRQE